MNTDQLIFNYFLQKQQWIKDVLLKPLKDDYGNFDRKPDFIKEEIISHAMWIIATQMILDLRVSTDQVFSFLESVNIEELLK